MSACLWNVVLSVGVLILFFFNGCFSVSVRRGRRRQPADGEAVLVQLPLEPVRRSVLREVRLGDETKSSQRKNVYDKKREKEKEKQTKEGEREHKGQTGKRGKQKKEAQRKKEKRETSKHEKKLFLAKLK